MGFINEIKKNKYLYALAIPGFLFLAIFAYIPMFGHLIAFKDYKVSDGLWGSKWAGLKNFKFFFGSSDWIRVTFNTLFLNSLFLIFGLSIAIIIAIFLNEIQCIIFKKLAQSLIFLPYFISWMVVSTMVFALLNSETGMVNKLLESFGLNGVNWFQNAKMWPAILTIVNVWKFAGYNSVIFLSAIVGISGEFYESAKLDGASKLQQIWYITLPLLRPVIITLSLLGVGRIFFGDFGMIYGIIGDNALLYPTTDVIDTFSFRALRQLGNFSMASAVVFYQSVMGLVMIVIFNTIVKRIDKESSLF